MPPKVLRYHSTAARAPWSEVYPEGPVFFSATHTAFRGSHALPTGWLMVGVCIRLVTSVCQLRYDHMEQDPTEPRTGRSTFLLSSGGAGGGYY